MKNSEMTTGQKLALSFRPFISPGVKTVADADAVVIDMGKAIDNALNNDVLVMRVSQFLSSLEYEKLTDFQSKCVLLIEKELKKFND